MKRTAERGSGLGREAPTQKKAKAKVGLIGHTGND